MKILKLIALSALVYSSASLAISSGIKSNRENECAIWLCLPTGFAGPGCSAAHRAFISRVTDISHKGVRRYTDIPNFGVCKDDEPKLQSSVNVPQSQLAYVTTYEIRMPAYNTATRWEWVYEESSRQYGCDKVDKYGKCYKRKYQVVAAVSTTPARTFESSIPIHKYSTINIGDREYKKDLVAPYKTFSEVRVDGKIVGDRYYR